MTTACNILFLGYFEDILTNKIAKSAFNHSFNVCDRADLQKLWCASHFPHYSANYRNNIYDIKKDSLEIDLMFVTHSPITRGITKFLDNWLLYSFYLANYTCLLFDVWYIYVYWWKFTFLAVCNIFKSLINHWLLLVKIRYNCPIIFISYHRKITNCWTRFGRNLTTEKTLVKSYRN
jgi:hypothetical protein